MSFVLAPELLAAATRHARAEFPDESCGLIVGDSYWACPNDAKDPSRDFKIDALVLAAAENLGELAAVVHSHPNGPNCPSGTDITMQARGDLPWVIIPLDADNVHAPIVFGECLPIAPVIGRDFIHGWHDCLATIRDVHRLGREALALQGVDWPHPPIDMPNFPRDIDWWQDGTTDHYRDLFPAAGFREIASSEAQPGDVFLAITPGPQNPHKRMNHGGVLLGGNLLLHHLPGRLSRREPAGNWLRAVHLWLRHTSVSDA